VDLAGGHEPLEFGECGRRVGSEEAAHRDHRLPGGQDEFCCGVGSADGEQVLGVAAMRGEVSDQLVRQVLCDAGPGVGLETGRAPVGRGADRRRLAALEPGRRIGSGADSADSPMSRPPDSGPAEARPAAADLMVVSE
jgi:hypothetical protein